jgi:transketolase
MTLRLADHCGLHLSRLAETDERIRVLDGDLADSDGALHFAERHPDRFLMAGIAEQSMVSVAAGMASCGLRPWVFSFAAFLCYRAYDQVRVSVSQAGQPVTLVGSHSGGLSSRNGKTHAALNDIALMASLPHMTVWAPAGPREVAFAVDAILAAGAPAYLRLPRRPLEDLPSDSDTPEAFRWLGAPGPVAFAGTGLGTHLALEAAERLRAEGTADLPVLHIPQVAPLPAGLADALSGVETLFVVEDHVTFGGLASLLQGLGPVTRGLRITPFGWPLSWAGQSGDDLDLLRLHGLAPEQIASSVAGALLAPA